MPELPPMDMSHAQQLFVEDDTLNDVRVQGTRDALDGVVNALMAMDTTPASPLSLDELRRGSADAGLTAMVAELAPKKLVVLNVELRNGEHISSYRCFQLHTTPDALVLESGPHLNTTLVVVKDLTLAECAYLETLL